MIKNDLKTFLIYTIFSVTELVLCMNSSKSYNEDGEGIWIHRLSVHKQKRNNYLSDKPLSHFRKLYKPTLRGDLIFMPSFWKEGMSIFCIIKIETIFVNRHKSQAIQPIIFHSALQTSFEPL